MMTMASAKISPKVGVLGCGYWGRNLVRNFHALGALAAVADATAKGRETASQLAPGALLHETLEGLLCMPEIQGIVLASPAITHTPLGLKVLSAGKDLFVEKPMSLTFEDACTLTRAAKDTGRILQVGHLLEYHPCFEQLRDGVSAGRIGQVSLIESRRCNFGKVRTEEDALWSLAPHDISMILRLTGCLPESVSCHGTRALGTERADCATAVLRFTRGITAHVMCNWLSPIKEQRLTAIGSLGAAVFDDTSKDRKLTWHGQRVEWKDGTPELLKTDPEPGAMPEEEPLRRECAAFIEAIQSRRQPLADGESGAAVIAVLEACRDSMNADGAVVNVRQMKARIPVATQ